MNHLMNDMERLEKLDEAWRLYKDRTLPSWRRDSAKEEAFWKEISQGYDCRYNLAKENEGLFELLVAYCQRSKSFLDIGCGTGNFLIPLSTYVDKAYGLDASKSMLAIAQEKALQKHLAHIDFICGDIEEDRERERIKADFTLSVNSLYRVTSIVTALQHMYDMTNRIMTVVRTVQTPLCKTYYDEHHIPYDVNTDYTLMEKWFSLKDPLYHKRTFYHDKTYEFNSREGFLRSIEAEVRQVAVHIEKEKLIENLCQFYENQGSYKVPKSHEVRVYTITK